MRKLILFFIFSISSLIFAQQDSLKLFIAYPAHSDTVNYYRIRISGSTTPGAGLTINSQDVKVYPSGAFGYLVYLKEGINKISVESRLDEKYKSVEINILRKPGLKSLPEEPVAIESAFMEPSQDLMLIPGDVLNVRFKGSPGGTAKFKFGKWGKDIPMTELPLDETGGLKGIYTGNLILTDKGDREPEKIEFELKGKNKKKVKIKTEAAVKVYSKKVSLVGEIINENTISRIQPNGAILTTFDKGVKVNINGKFGSNYRIKLAEKLHCFIHESDLELLPEGTVFNKSRIGGISVENTKTHLIFKIGMSDKCPYLVEESLDPLTINLKVFNAYEGGGWMKYPEGDSLIKFINRKQVSDDIFTLNISLNINRIWGYKIKYFGNMLYFYVKKPPEFYAEPESALKGVKIVLDAGHGGEHLGAVGGTGLMEKDVNLNYTFKLAEMLENEGAEVILTRTIDTTMFLTPRYRIADSLNADLFVWLHNNSTGLVSDPFEIKGTSTYYTHPHSFEISRLTYKHLKSLGLDPFGNISAWFYITRQSSVLTFLVEGAFLSNVEDEMLLLDDQFLEDLAGAVFNGIKEYFEKARNEIFSLAQN